MIPSAAPPYAPPSDTPLQRLERQLNTLKLMAFANFILTFAVLMMVWSR